MELTNNEKDIVNEVLLDTIAQLREKIVENPQYEQLAPEQFAESVLTDFKNEQEQKIKLQTDPNIVKVDQEVLMEIEQSSQITKSADEIIQQEVTIPEVTEFVQSVIKTEQIQSVLKSILLIPEQMMSEAFRNVFHSVQESDELLSLLESEKPAQSQNENDELKSQLNDRMSALERRKLELQKRKENLKQNMKNEFQEKKAQQLSWREILNQKRVENENKRERSRQLRRHIEQTRRAIRKQERSHTEFVREGQSIINAYSPNRIKILDHFRQEILPALIADLRNMKGTLQHFSNQNQIAAQTYSQKLIMEKEALKFALMRQAHQMETLNKTLAILKKENLTTINLIASGEQYEQALLRIEALKKGFMVRKYHHRRPKKVAVRWIQLSSDGTYLYYARDSHLKRKFKKFRTNTIKDVLCGPCSALFAKHIIYGDDLPSLIFSILFQDQRTLDFSIPQQKVIKSQTQFQNLPVDEQSKFIKNGSSYIRNIARENYETVFLALTEISSAFDPSNRTRFTSAKLRWMSFVVEVTVGQHKRMQPRQYHTARKHLRRIFGYRYYETYFEKIQALNEQNLKRDDTSIFSFLEGEFFEQKTIAEFSESLSHARKELVETYPQ
eukprot:c17497_g1_i1.p1 GENE.c17497_g1_i1~~c17497_g1_i1.p1  ORF type:complete len:624 (+),score=214.71 c17497_g1_i1:32-1873(+)